MNANNRFSLSIDIGGTKIHVSTYDSQGTVGVSKRYQTKEFFSRQNPEDLQLFLSEVAKDFPKESYDKVGLAMNCAIKNNSIVYSSLLGGKVRIDLLSLFQKNFNFKYFTADNDVVCMAKSEIVHGIGKTFSHFVYINLGTGIRLTIVDEGHIVSGINGLAGEIALLPIWVPELNQFVDIDTLISGKGLAYLSEKISQQKRSAEEVFAFQDQKVIKVFVTQLAGLLRLCTYMFNPSAFILGGSVTKSSPHWLPQVIDAYGKYTHELFATKQILISSVEDSASKGAIISLE